MRESIDLGFLPPIEDTADRDSVFAILFSAVAAIGLVGLVLMACLLSEHRAPPQAPQHRVVVRV